MLLLANYRVSGSDSLCRLDLGMYFNKTAKINCAKALREPGKGRRRSIGSRSLIEIGSFGATLVAAVEQRQQRSSPHLRLLVLNPDRPRVGYVDPPLPYVDAVTPG